MHLCVIECNMKRLGSRVKQKKRLSYKKISIVCWNVRSLVESKGS